MRKLNAYQNALAELEALQNKIASLEQSDELKKGLEFKKKLEALMSKYKMSSEDLLSMFGANAAPAKSSGKRRAPRPVKVYKNPKTGETVETRGGNHKTLNTWKQKYGKEKVESWLVS
ncbi:DNA-binding protein H-NS [Hahella chejuensis KCTC 2396]|uniref:DNA-binding protein H-NS n=1 Tax=Hahella chejuensis (strain KCTC 2396) TaxID=349521 RepID=Q2SGZ3_HAHCH|nr:histone-like nucleoid-structuring protein, MvaT/MvaU family [Hahella chejuensis]ABC30081.1 DNA-binding protein H-NS [Hahella chejuensis KCTC 2396]